MRNHIIVPCNPHLFRVIDAFRDMGTIEWRQTTSKAEAGDYAYIYLGRPYSAVKFKCVIEETDIKEEYLRYDDNKYDLGINAAHAEKYMRIKMIKEYDDNELTMNDLRENGITTFQCQTKANDRLAEFLKTK